MNEIDRFLSGKLKLKFLKMMVKFLKMMAQLLKMMAKFLKMVIRIKMGRTECCLALSKERTCISSRSRTTAKPTHGYLCCPWKWRSKAKILEGRKEFSRSSARALKAKAKAKAEGQGVWQLVGISQRSQTKTSQRLYRKTGPLWVSWQCQIQNPKKKNSHSRKTVLSELSLPSLSAATRI